MKKYVYMSQGTFNQKFPTNGAIILQYDTAKKQFIVIDLINNLKVKPGGSGTITEAILEAKLADYATKTQVQTVSNKISGFFKIQGSCSSAELNSKQKVQGHVWQVDDKEYVWNGSAWVQFGFDVDLSDYYTREEIDTKGFLTEHQSLSGKVDKVEGKSLIDNTEIERLATLNNYNDSQLRTAISGKVDKVQGKSLIDDTEIARLANVDNYVDTQLRTAISGKADKTQIPLSTSQLLNDSGFLTQHQSLSGKVDKVENSVSGNIPLLNSDGNIFDSNKYIGDETLGTLITNQQLTQNVINQLGITSDFQIKVGADHSSVMSNEYVYDGIHIASYGDQNGLSLYYDQGEWKKTQVIFFANDLYDTFKYKKGQEELSAQLLVDELPTDGSLKNAGINFQTNEIIGTTSATIKIKTLSDNVIHQFKVGRVYDNNTLATETAVAAVKTEIINSIPTKLSQLTNDVPYLTKTCLPFPDDLLDYAQPGDTSTTLAFCQAFDNLGLAQQGRIYLGQISNFSDMPFDGNAECMITVCEDNVFTLEMFSTNIPMNHWIATYPGTVTDDSLICPWRGNLTCSISTMGKDTQDNVPIYTPTKDYDGTTKKYVDDAISGVLSGINAILDSINGEEL